MTMMKSLRERIRSQRGQVIIMFAAIFTVFTIVGVITVDFGLWLSERRGAQTDADLPALAGAREYMLWLAEGNRCENGGAPDQAVEDAVDNWFSLNNGGNASLVSVEADCPCVDVRVRHDSETLFSSFYSPVFDEVSDNIGARAKACAGAVNAPGNVIPLDTYKTCEGNAGPCFNEDGTPKFGTMCGLEFGAQGPGDCDHNPRGMLDLDTDPGYCSDAGGSGSIEELIRDGPPGMCFVNAGTSCGSDPWADCASTQTGNKQDVLDGTSARILKNHLCDDNYPDPDGVSNVDDLSEAAEAVPPSPTGIYQARDCDPLADGKQISQRLVSIIVFDDYPDQNNTGYPIASFGGFYLKGCTKTVEECVDPDHEWSVDELNCEMHGQIGQVVVCGEFLRLTVEGSWIGRVDPSSTMFSIALVDWEGGGTPVPTTAPTVAPTATRAPTDTPVPPPTPTPKKTPKPTKEH